MKNQKEWIRAAVRCRFLGSENFQLVHVVDWLIDWLVHSLWRFVFDWLIGWSVILSSTPSPTRFWNFWCQYVSSRYPEYNKNGFRSEKSKLTELSRFLFPISQSINRHTPFICMLTTGIMQMNSRSIDWLIWFDFSFFILPFQAPPSPSKSQKGLSCDFFPDYKCKQSPYPVITTCRKVPTCSLCARCGSLGDHTVSLRRVVVSRVYSTNMDADSWM